MCGAPSYQTASPAPGSPTTPGATELSQNIAGLLAYITFVPAIVFLSVSPYNRNSFVRFHAFQSIFFYASWFLVHVVFQTSFLFLGLVGFALLPIQGLIGLAFFVLWIVCMVKAYGNEKFKLPILGQLAEQQAQKS